MKNKVYTRIASNIERLQNKRNADIKRCKDIIVEHEANIQDAGKHITVNDDIEEYLIASEKMAKSEAVIKACNEKIHLLKTKGMMSEADYEADIKAIRSEQQKIVDEAFKSIVPLMIQMFRLYSDMFKEVQAFNELIKADADVAKHDLGPTGIVTYSNDKYDLITSYVGRLKFQMEHHQKLSEYFTKH